MIRARFRANERDPRPVVWPINHPYWVTGYGEGYATLVAYADDEAEILRNWPDATHIDAGFRDDYNFTDRFPEPEWFKTQRASANEQLWKTIAAGAITPEKMAPKGDDT